MTEHASSVEDLPVSGRLLYAVVLPALCPPVFFVIAAAPFFHRDGMEALVGLAITGYYLPRSLLITVITDLAIARTVRSSRGRLFMYGMSPNALLLFVFGILSTAGQESVLKHAVGH